MHKPIVLSCIFLATIALANSIDGPDLHYGLLTVGKIIKQFINSQGEDLKIADGIHIIDTVSPNEVSGRADDSSLLGIVENYLQTHELRIKLAELMPNSYDFSRALKDATGSENFDVGTARRKNRGGGGAALLLLGSLFASTLGAIGIGGAGLLAMKALTVAAMALLLSAVIGVKKLASSHDDGGGHHVIHAGHGQDHRRKRDAADLAYKGWSPYSIS